MQADAEEARLLLLLPKKHICAPGMGGKEKHVKGKEDIRCCAHTFFQGRHSLALVGVI